jgi:hypothetical protein
MVKKYLSDMLREKGSWADVVEYIDDKYCNDPFYKMYLLQKALPLTENDPSSYVMVEAVKKLVESEVVDMKNYS